MKYIDWQVIGNVTLNNRFSTCESFTGYFLANSHEMALEKYDAFAKENFGEMYSSHSVSNCMEMGR
jgi:hypothetical protein